MLLLALLLVLLQLQQWKLEFTRFLFEKKEGILFLLVR